VIYLNEKLQVYTFTCTANPLLSFTGILFPGMLFPWQAYVNIHASLSLHMCFFFVRKQDVEVGSWRRGRGLFRREV
jgi:hypothetical protein